MLYCQEANPSVLYSALLTQHSALFFEEVSTLRKPKRFTDPAAYAQAEPPLDRPQVVQAALALLDEVGLDGLTMRRLADRLGIKAASLYWHVRDKDDLLQLLADAICAPMQSPDPALPWRERLAAAGRDYRRMLLAHRDAGRVLASSGAPSGPNRLRLVESVLRTLLDAGFSPRDAAYAAFVLNDYGALFVMEEQQFAEAAQQDSEAGQRWVSMLPPDAYPSIRAVAPYLVDGNTDQRFEFGLHILLDGLEARLTKTGGDSA